MIIYKITCAYVGVSINFFVYLFINLYRFFLSLSLVDMYYLPLR